MAILRQWIQAATVALDQATWALRVGLAPVDVSKDVALSGFQPSVTLWAPSAGHRILLSSLTFTVDADTTIAVFRGSNLSGKRLIYQAFKAGTGASIAYLPLFACGVDEALKVSSTAGNVNFTVTGIEEAA